jgi:DNA polymerase-1
MKIIDTASLLLLDSFEKELVYCGFDTMMTHEILAHLQGEFDSVSLATYARSRSLLGSTLDMMKRGFKIDQQKKDAYLPVLQARRDLWQSYLDLLAHEVWGKPLNINSSVQMPAFFYDWLFLPVQYETKKGEKKISTGRKAMESLRDSHVKAMPFCILVLALRDIDKMLSVLKRPLHEGRWHAQFNIAGTDTWRFSSSEHPVFGGANLQNIDDEMRRLFIPDVNYTLFQVDQQGAEARAVAFLSGDEEYIKAVVAGDAHTMVASMVFGFPPIRDEAEKEFYRGNSYRQISKKFSHGSNYNGTPRTLAIQARTPISLVEEFQTKYFKRFPGIKEWHTWTSRELQTKGYLVNAFGDRRQFWDRTWADETLRAAVAFQPQSLVGRLTGLVSQRIYEHYQDDPSVQLLANGHDAVIFQIQTKKIDTELPNVLKLLDYPLEVTDIKGTKRTLCIPWDASRGHNWGKFDPKKPDVNPRGLK